MASVKLAPASMGSHQNSQYGNLSFGKTGVIKTLAGTPIDFSAWFAVQGLLKGPAPKDSNFTNVDVTGNADGTLEFSFDANSNDIVEGSYTLIVYGNPTNGDPTQLIGFGSLVIKP